MKTFFCLAALVAVSVALSADTYAYTHASWTAKFNRTYSSDVERQLRFEIFKDNLDKIEKHNLEGHSWTMGLNAFSDMTQHEFSSKMLGYKPRAADYVSPAVHTFNGEELAASVNWVTAGAVTNVKNQGQCGSCWTFSTTGAIESATAIKSGKAPVSLSEQEIVDCSHACTDEPPYGSVCNQGCNGGWPWAAMSSVVQWKGLATEAQYPYTAMTGECHRNASTMLHSPITNWTCLSGAGAPDGGPASEVDMVEFLYKNGPLSIALDANPLQFYDGGIVDPYSWDPLFGCSRSSLDHALLITGYGTYKSDFDGEIPSWTVKNSWGADWGNDGYFFIRRGNNECGIAEAVTHPVVA